MTVSRQRPLHLPPIGLAVPGRLSIIIDGQFGSSGKGLAASYVGASESVGIAVTNAAPNAGHSFFDIYGDKKVAHHLPVTGLADDRSLKYLSAGSIIDPDMFLAEIERLDVDPSTVFVHPRAAVITPEDVVLERARSSGAARIASTQKGVGAALARKVRREARLAGEHPALAPFVRTIDLADLLQQGLSGVMEVPQGFGLGLNSGLSYPHCTGREISVSAALSDAQLHPAWLGKTLMVVRTHPIRVGHLIEQTEGTGEKDGNMIGDSGPFYPDSAEITWDEVGVPPEITTVTGRVRRVACFSVEQYRDAVRALRPDFVLLNFVNYLRDPKAVHALLGRMNAVQPVSHLGFGPSPRDVVPVAQWAPQWDAQWAAERTRRDREGGEACEPGRAG